MSQDISGTSRFSIAFSSQALDIQQNENLNRAVIYANNKQIHVDGSLAVATKIVVYDLHGRTVLKSQLSKASSKVHLDGQRLDTGVYLVKLENTTGTKTQKIIIK